jgi:hypothetical protein
MGEITPAMAVAVGQSRAAKILIPMNKCDKLVVGARNMPVAEMVTEAVSILREQLAL